MSNLPEIDASKVEQKLLTRLADQIKQNVRLEALAEALRDERDSLIIHRDSLVHQLEELNTDTDGE